MLQINATRLPLFSVVLSRQHRPTCGWMGPRAYGVVGG
jgi:hypothetical protein